MPLIDATSIESTNFAVARSFASKFIGIPCIMPILERNELILREKILLFIEKKREKMTFLPSGARFNFCRVDDRCIEHFAQLHTTTSAKIFIRNSI
jgi:hypothetical protein